MNRKRNRGWRRKINYSKARRKKTISKSFCKNGWYKYDGQYIKGKIHCSCSECSPRTNNRGRYGAAINYKRSDKQKVDAMQYQINEYNEGF